MAEKKHQQLYLVARYVDADDSEEVYFVKRDFRYNPARLICSCGAFLANVIDVEKNPGPAGTQVVPVCRHTMHAANHLTKGHEILIDKPAPDSVIHNLDERVAFWWTERNVKQFILGDEPS